MGLLPYSYCSSGVLVSFFMFTMSYRYKFPSAACRINISILNILNRSRSPVSLLYTGSANLVVNLYQPNFASTLCFPLKRISLITTIFFPPKSHITLIFLSTKYPPFQSDALRYVYGKKNIQRIL